MTDPLDDAADPRKSRLTAQPLDPGLHVVATPIGNLRDITLRALDVLGAADAVLAEDTRMTRRLLDAHGIRAKVERYDDHVDEAARAGVLARLEAGAALALVSDAGTPLVSDPGFKLVRAAAAAGVRIHPVPGASAALAALVMAGLPTDRFLFAGFAPAKAGARRTWLAELAHVRATLVLYETGPRLAASLGDMAAVLGDRPAAVTREITKLFEEARRGTLGALAAHYAAAGPPKGEIVVVIGPPDEAVAAPDIDGALRAALEGRSVKDAAALVAAATGAPKREVYQRALALSQER
jgi:16S rRNA (cytidine1402-2'-O)-methyltransferase